MRNRIAASPDTLEVDMDMDTLRERALEKAREVLHDPWADPVAEDTVRHVAAVLLEFAADLLDEQVKSHPPDSLAWQYQVREVDAECRRVAADLREGR